MPSEADSNDLGRTFQRTLVVVGVLVAVAFVWIAHQMFLLIFAGVLFGILLDGLAGIIARLFHLKRGWALLITILALCVFVGGVISMLSPGIGSQMLVLKRELPRSLERLRIELGQYDWGRLLLHLFSAAGNAPGAVFRSDSAIIVSGVAGVVQITVGILTGMVLIFVIGIFAAAEPAMYRRGVLRLIAPQHAASAERILNAVRERMWWWLIGVSGSMISLTILAFIGLRILGIPLALTLALLTGLITFIPNFGAVLSAIPPVLIGLMQSPEKALAVIVLYIIIQVLEADLITPLIQRRAIRLPPVLGIGAQLTFAVLFGFLGLLLAAPLVAGLLAIVSSVSAERIVRNEELSRSAPLQ
jgi:predicted PurR-regulated permease PerM